MMEADNTFSGIFGNVPSKPKNSEPKAEREDTPAIIKQPLPETDTHNNDVTGNLIRKRGRRRKVTDSTDGPTADKVGHFSCICDKDLIAKVRAIAWQEHLTVRAVVENMFTKCITKYEKKRGPVLIEQSQPSEELF